MTPFDRIQERRAALKLSQHALCLRAGLNKDTLAVAKKRGGNMDLPTLSAFAAALDTTVAALLGETPGAAADPAIRRLPLMRLMKSPLNPRKTFDAAKLAELADSIAEKGLLQNLVVRERGETSFTIVAGERRLRALDELYRQNRLPADLRDGGIPCRVIEADDAEHLALALLENLQREDVNPLEEAEGFAKLQALDPAKWKPSVIAGKIGVSARHVQGRLALVGKLCDEAKDLLAGGGINATQARVLTVAPLDQQRRLLANGLPSYCRTADELRDHLTRAWIPVGRAAFKLEDYPHPEEIGTDPDTGKRYFTNPDAFKAEQRKAAEAKVEALKAEGWAWVEMTSYFFEGDYEKCPDKARAGAVVMYRDWEGTVAVHTGLRRRGEGGADEAAGPSPWQIEREAVAARRQIAETLRAAVAAKLAVDADMAMRVLLVDRLTDRDLLDPWNDNLPVDAEGPLAPLARLLDPADEDDVADVDAALAHLILRSRELRPSAALRAVVAARLDGIAGDGRPEPELLALARYYAIPVPPELAGDQADVEDARRGPAGAAPADDAAAGADEDDDDPLAIPAFLRRQDPPSVADGLEEEAAP